MQAYIFILFFVLSEAVVRLPNSPIDWLRMHFPTQTLRTPTTLAVHFSRNSTDIVCMRFCSNNYHFHILAKMAKPIRLQTLFFFLFY